MPVHPVAASTAELDIVRGYTTPAPSLQRSAADAARVAANGSEAGDGGFDDDKVTVVIVVEQDDTAVALE